MIIDDKHEIAFIHIPKCAGTTIRQYLQEYDRSQGEFTARVDMHEKLGMLDYVHIPLFVLKEHFPEEFELVQKYWSFTVIRDPYSRFASSVSQRLKKYRGRPIETLSESEVRREVQDCISFLENGAEEKEMLPYDYIHFQRQSDYVYLGEEKIVDCVYTTDQVSELVDLLLEKLGSGTPLEEKAEGVSGNRKNRALVYRNENIRYLMMMLRPIKRILTLFLTDKTKEVIKSNIYVTRDSRMSDVFSDDSVRRFVERYYSRDIELYERVI